MEKNLRLLLRLSSSFTTLNCKVDEYSLEEIKMKRQIGPVTCVHSYGQLDSQKRRGRGEEKRLLKISRTLHTLTKMNGNQTEGGVEDQMKRLQKAKIVKLV